MQDGHQRPCGRTWGFIGLVELDPCQTVGGSKCLSMRTSLTEDMSSLETQVKKRHPTRQMCAYWRR